jgi:outer membrane protein TolC
MLATDDEIADLAAKLSEMLGTPVDPTTELVVPASPALDESLTPASLADAALATSPELEAAQQQLERARSGVRAARASYIPDVYVYGTELYQDAVALLPENSFSVGIKAQWTVFDFGKREADIGERQASRRTAEENLVRVRREIATEVAEAQRKVQRMARSTALAGEVVGLRREALRITQDQEGSGLVLASQRREAEAGLATAEADWLAAEVGRRLAIAELRRVLGRNGP